MPERIVYCIDTSALIDLKMLYPRDVFPSLWEKLVELINQGRLIAPREVFKEIKKKDDELLRWVKKHKRIFKDLNPEQIETVKEIQQRFPALVDPAKEIPEADPFVIALAITKNMDRYLFGEKCIVVTQERRTGTGGGRPRIPDVCLAYGIECLYGHTALAEFFEQEGWRF